MMESVGLIIGIKFVKIRAIRMMKAKEAGMVTGGIALIRKIGDGNHRETLSVREKLLSSYHNKEFISKILHCNY